MCEFVFDWQGLLRVWTEQTKNFDLVWHSCTLHSYFHLNACTPLRSFLIIFKPEDIGWHSNVHLCTAKISLRAQEFADLVLVKTPLYIVQFSFAKSWIISFDICRWPRCCGWIKILPAFRLVQMAREGIRGRARWELRSTPTFKNNNLPQENT